MVHELAHLIFGIPDLYDQTPARPKKPSSSGVGAFCIMAAGEWGKSTTDKYSGQTPVMPCAWVKYDRGWVSAGRTNGVKYLTAPGSSLANASNTVFKSPGLQGDEFFLVENRQPFSFDRGMEKYLGKGFGGLAIWHIDQSVQTNNDDDHRKVDLEEADGTLMGTAAGQKTDLWYAGNRTIFNNITAPNSRLYTNIQSDLSVLDISESREVMSAAILKCPRLNEHDHAL